VKELDDLMPLLPVKVRQSFAIARAVIDYEKAKLDLLREAATKGGIGGFWFKSRMEILTALSLSRMATIRSASETL